MSEALQSQTSSPPVPARRGAAPLPRGRHRPRDAYFSGQFAMRFSHSSCYNAKQGPIFTLPSMGVTPTACSPLTFHITTTLSLPPSMKNNVVLLWQRRVRVVFQQSVQNVLCSAKIYIPDGRSIRYRGSNPFKRIRECHWHWKSNPVSIILLFIENILLSPSSIQLNLL